MGVITVAFSKLGKPITKTPPYVFGHVSPLITGLDDEDVAGLYSPIPQCKSYATKSPFALFMARWHRVTFVSLELYDVALLPPLILMVAFPLVHLAIIDADDWANEVSNGLYAPKFILVVEI